MAVGCLAVSQRSSHALGGALLEAGGLEGLVGSLGPGDLTESKPGVHSITNVS